MTTMGLCDGIQRHLVIEPVGRPIIGPLVLACSDWTQQVLVEGEGIAAILGNGRYLRTSGRLYGNLLRLIVYPEGTSKAFGAWRKAAGLRQPHVQVEPHDRSGSHLMQIYLKKPKDVHYHGVEGHPKTGGEQIAEHDHFVCVRMSDGLTRRWSPDTIR